MVTVGNLLRPARRVRALVGPHRARFQWILTLAACLALLLLGACKDPPAPKGGTKGLRGDHSAAGAASGKATEAADTQAIWAYKDGSGREVFVNGKEAVPPEFRAKARRLGLEKISLNEDVGNRERDETNQQYDALKAKEAKEAAEAAARAAASAESGGMGRAGTSVSEKDPLAGLGIEADNDCLAQKAKALQGGIGRAAGASGEPGSAALAEDTGPKKPFLDRAWAEYPYLVVVGAMAIGLILITPIASKVMPEGKWAKLLVGVLPLLVVVGGIAHVSAQMKKGTAGIKDMLGVKTPAGCKDEVAGAASAGSAAATTAPTRSPPTVSAPLTPTGTTPKAAGAARTKPK